MSIKRDILWRVNLVYLLLVGVGIAVTVQVMSIQFVQSEHWLEQMQVTAKIDTIEGERGNIYSEDGLMLATSLPTFEIRMDFGSPALTEEVFDKGVDSLSWHLARHFRDKSEQEYRNILLKARKKKHRYFEIKRRVNYQDLKAMKTWPIFRLGKYKGGFIANQLNKRTRPFGSLAQRTIGYPRKNAQSIGIEDTFDEQLSGEKALKIFQRIPGGTWVPISDADVLPENGHDIHTSIDVKLQDVVQTALLKALRKHRANHGCVVVMEVKTGKIKAIANLGLGTDSTYWEKYNYAVGESTEPGSTIKLASLLALLHTEGVDEQTMVNIEGGKMRFYDRYMRDATPHHEAVVPLAKAFKISSNVGISSLVNHYFSDEPERFTDYLHQFRLHEPTGIEIRGEPFPTIKKVNSSGWDGTTLPWMSVGYAIKFTPLQLLSFYNAVANDGLYVQPRIVEKAVDGDRIVETFKQSRPTRICSEEMAARAKAILAGVVAEGTAKAIHSDDIQMAGKTGTAKLAEDNRGYQKIYQASFAGFFPVNDPEFSMIVVINSPSRGGYYGSAVAAPVFREVVDKYYISRYLQPQAPQLMAATTATPTQAGFKKDLQHLYHHFGIRYQNHAKSDWVIPGSRQDTIILENRIIKEESIANVMGMGLRDAIYILENQGLKVRFRGKGKVVKQSIRPGEGFREGQTITIDLS